VELIAPADVKQVKNAPVVARMVFVLAKVNKRKLPADEAGFLTY
jgi:hypothetical protein